MLVHSFVELMRSLAPEVILGIGVIAYLSAHVGLLLYPVRLRR